MSIVVVASSQKNLVIHTIALLQTLTVSIKPSQILYIKILCTHLHITLNYLVYVHILCNLKCTIIFQCLSQVRPVQIRAAVLSVQHARLQRVNAPTTLRKTLQQNYAVGTILY